MQVQVQIRVQVQVRARVQVQDQELDLNRDSYCLLTICIVVAGGKIIEQISRVVVTVYYASGSKLKTYQDVNCYDGCCCCYCCRL